MALRSPPVNRTFFPPRKNRYPRHLRLTEPAMRPMIAFAFLLYPALASAAEKTVTISSAGVIPKGGEAALVPTGKPGPAQKGFNAELQTKEFDKALNLLGEGPFDVWFTPKGGKPVLATTNFKVVGGMNELKLGAYLGSIYVRNDDLPRVSGIVVTATDDPGPGDKGHAPIQTVQDYKNDIVVREGFYAVWIIPDNGAKARKLADKVRVLAGKQSVLPE